MQKYISLRVSTALYLSVFFLALHHVFVYFANASVLEFFFGLHTLQVLTVYGVASIIGISMFILLSKQNKVSTKKQLYMATLSEITCLCIMYIATATHMFTPSIALPLYIVTFCIHHLLTPYILYNLDTLFEAYTHAADRGKGRGIYLTMWNLPFVVVPLLLSTLSMQSLPIVYLISVSILFPFILTVSAYLQDPNIQEHTIAIPSTQTSFLSKLKIFWSDRLDRLSFITQTTLHLYYGVTGVLLPVYLYNRFGFDWGQIGILLAVTMTPFILTQIPFGEIEDKRHNEKFFFILGILVTILCTTLAAFVNPSIAGERSFFLLMFFLFFARIGCGLIEISTESIFYKHVTERDSFALLMFRSARLIPYALGLFAAFWI